MMSSTLRIAILWTILLMLGGCSLLSDPKDRVVARDAAIAAGVFTAWGVSKWDWFEHSPKFKSEGWFGKDTHAAGADKLGHLYTSYILSEAMLWDFKRNKVENPEKKAALAAFGAMTLIEIGDATSKKHGFSGEDFISNTIGVGASYFLSTRPEWGEKIDLRLEYSPSPGFPGKGDAAADYSGMKHLIAFKADGFEKLRNTPLRHFELQAGYYTRGFRSYDKGHFDEKTRNLYLGFGLNLSRIVGRENMFGKFLEYYQPPKTYLEARHKLK